MKPSKREVMALPANGADRSKDRHDLGQLASRIAQAALALKLLAVRTQLPASTVTLTESPIRSTSPTRRVRMSMRVPSDVPGGTLFCVDRHDP